MKRKLLSILTAVTMLIGLMPQTAFAAQTGSSDASRTVFDALGFDTRAPAGYEQEEGITDTPFGKTYTTMAEVDELFLMDMKSKKGNCTATDMSVAIMPIFSMKAIKILIFLPFRTPHRAK